MKQETYNKLKLAWKIYEYIMYALVFSIGLIALTFGAVYLGRKACEPNIQEVNKRDLKPKSLIDDNYEFYVGKLKTLDFLNTPLDSQSTGKGTNNYRDYFTFDVPQGYNYTDNVWVYFEGDFYIRVNNSNLIYRYARFQFAWQGSQDDPTYELSLTRVNFYNSSDSPTLFYDGSFVDRRLLAFSSITDVQVSNHHLHELYKGAVFDFYFEYVLRTDDSALFEFTEDYNFARLTSEVVTSERLIPPYNNQFNGDPLDEYVFYYLPFDFLSNRTYYRGIFLKLNKPGLIYKEGVLNVNYYGSLSQLQVVQVCYMLNLPTGDSPSGDTIAQWYNNSSNYDVACNKHVIKYDKYTDTQGEHNVPVYDYKDYDWVNESLRVTYIDLDYYNDQYQRVCYPRDNTMWGSSTYNKLTLYQVLNNGYSDYDYYTNTYNPNMNNHLGDVFSLISGAFGGLINLMYIQVIPGLTLGVLLLAPLIVTIIIVVLRLVKK